jgi:hypothetical protein
MFEKMFGYQQQALRRTNFDKQRRHFDFICLHHQWRNLDLNLCQLTTCSYTLFQAIKATKDLVFKVVVKCILSKKMQRLEEPLLSF